MTNVLVTGGAGFIGSHLCEALVARGHKVRVLDNLATGYLANLEGVKGRVEFIQGDATDRDACMKACKDIEVIFHEAAIPSVPRSMDNPVESHHSCLSTTVHMLEAARRMGVRRLINAASSSAYGDTEQLPKCEDATPRPMSVYAVAKVAGEHYCRVFAESLGVDTVNLRYFNIFGPRQDPSSPYSGVIAKFTKIMKAGKRPTIFGDGLQSRDFTYVANVVHANLLAMQKKEPLSGAVLNVGCGDRVTVLQLVDELNKILGTDLRPEFSPTRAGEVLHSQASWDRIRDVLGYQPQVRFAEGLRRTVEAEAD
ncbi:MAG TPA: SDR family oxidoreductase [Candidatus Brocadiia bacterium]|nr:SDR family oxidoreductase [Candidatus Brocadiia bacterium]